MFGLGPPQTRCLLSYCTSFTTRNGCEPRFQGVCAAKQGSKKTRKSCVNYVNQPIFGCFGPPDHSKNVLCNAISGLGTPRFLSVRAGSIQGRLDCSCPSTARSPGW